MSLFTKLFKKRKDSQPLRNVDPPLPDALEEWELEQLGPSIPFTKSQLRIVVFQESERRGRQVLFDSASLRSRTRVGRTSEPNGVVANGLPEGSTKSIPTARTHVPNGSASSSLEDQRKIVGQAMRPNKSDLKMLGEMIFGSIPIAVRSVITKVHELRSPAHIMLTKVYPVFVPLAKDADSEEDTQGCRYISESRSSVSSEESLSLHSPPSINAIPARLNRLFHSAGPSPILTPSHSSSSLSSLTFSPPKSLAPFIGGASFQKRWKRNHSTSIDNSVKYLLQNENIEDFPDGYTREKKKIIAVACLISLPENNVSQKESFQEFFFTHCPIFEHALNLFKAQLELALSDTTRFGELIVAAYEEFAENLVAFIVAPRLPRPMWMVIAMEKIPDESYIAVLRFRLVKTLAELWIRHDTKETQFFLSRLLTAVMTGHLGWVSTVTPTNSQTETYKMKHEPSWIQPLAKSHPYNPLWAQLGDLLGLCGTPGRLTKTVLVSKNHRLLSAYLHFLSYFIRTTDVLFHRFESISAASSIEESSSTVIESPDISRNRRYYSGDNGFRSSALFNKCKRTSGSRSRAPSCGEQNLPRHSLHQSSAKTFSQDSSSPDQSVFDARSRHTTADGVPIHRTNSVSRSLAGISHVTSRSSIAEELYPDNATDANKLEAVCQVAATVLSTVKESEVGRYRRYTTSFGRHDAVEKFDRDAYRNHHKTYGQKVFSISKFPEKPLVLHVDDVPISRFKAIVTKQKFTDQAFENTASFATSLLAAPRKKYTPFFALQGCTAVNMEILSQDLQVAAENGFTDETVTEASAVVANLDDFTVQMITCSTRKYPRGVTIPIKPSSSLRCRTFDCQGSNYVMQILESTANLWKLKTTPEFCLTHLEDRMQEIYLSSCAMVSFIQHQMTMDTKEMMELLGMEMSDFPLLMAVATTHAPEMLSEFDLRGLYEQPRLF